MVEKKTNSALEMLRKITEETGTEAHVPRRPKIDPVAMYSDMQSMTLGDYISAAQVFNREMLGTSEKYSRQSKAYYTMFVFEERIKRLSDHNSYVQ
tara:strand:- start:21 stop:308 length:288 start_codon:yes stop_codon:yes gene_type:complete